MSAPGPARVCVLVLAGGAGWEAGVLRALADSGILVTRRCVDVPDLMAAATARGAAVAVVAGELPLLDADAVLHLLRYDVRTLAVAAEPSLADRLARLGVVETTSTAPDEVVAGVRRIAERDVAVEPTRASAEPASPTGRGRVVAVCGPTGAPGRSTIALGLAGALAAGGRATVLVDADPYGGTIAQHLGVLDEMSGLLSVARMANLGTLDLASFARSCRRVGPSLEVLTGLPRADRRVEVRPGALGTVLETGAALGAVVVDCGFCLEDDDLPTARDRITLDAIGVADEVVAVGSAEPVGLARLARGLVELRDLVGSRPLRVVVNRMRPSLGWSERDIVGMVEGYVRPAGVHFLPDDGPLLDRALVGGRMVAELGESRLRSALEEVAAAVFAGEGPSITGSRRRHRLPGRRRSVAQAPNSR